MAVIEDASQIAGARRNTRQLASDLEFDAEAAEKAAIVVTEACTNLLKHAVHGRIVVGAAAEERAGQDQVIEILALDSGPGISDFGQSLEDGYSTTGTAGTGLGAIARLSAYFEIYSRPGRGLALLSRISGNYHGKLPIGTVAAVRVPKPGQDVCGDDWGMMSCHERRTFLLADGLGHGPDAARASRTAVEVLYRNPDLPPGEMLTAVHEALRHTRGAAVAIARVDSVRGIVTFTGLGNISAVISSLGEPVRHMVSVNGTAGMECRHIREFTYPWTEGSKMILHSDGIGTSWSLADYPFLVHHDPAVIAGVIYRDFSRGNDDATIVVAT